eukprot:267096-Rhodomonas_salina.4
MAGSWKASMAGISDKLPLPAYELCDVRYCHSCCICIRVLRCPVLTWHAAARKISRLAPLSGMASDGAGGHCSRDAATGTPITSVALPQTHS